MNKKCLSIEQMKQLEELCLDISDASMCWVNHNYLTINGRKLWTDTPRGREYSTDIIPSYTLQDILEKLYNIESEIFYSLNPSYIVSINFYKYSDGIRCCFLRDKIPVHESVGKDSLDTAYNMLIWCIKNNYI